MTRRQTALAANSMEPHRSKSGHLVWAYFFDDHVHLYFNDGPPMTHEQVNYEQYEHLLATDQLKGDDSPVEYSGLDRSCDAYYGMGS